jgi:peptide/nickel transport system substrate-binding protein
MYDPEGAEKLLDEAGYPRGADGIRFKTSLLHTPRHGTSYAELAVSYWGEIGVDVEIQAVSSDTEFSAIFGEASHEALITAAMGLHYFTEAAVDRFYTDARGNVAAVSDPQFEAVIDALRATSDLEEYQRLFREANQYAIEKHWSIWGPDSPQYHVTQPWVKGYNGEASMGNWQWGELFARIWIDQELKAEMGH